MSISILLGIIFIIAIAVFVMTQALLVWQRFNELSASVTERRRDHTQLEIRIDGMQDKITSIECNIDDIKSSTSRVEHKLLEMAKEFKKGNNEN